MGLQAAKGEEEAADGGEQLLAEEEGEGCYQGDMHDHGEDIPLGSGVQPAVTHSTDDDLPGVEQEVCGEGHEV